MVAAAFSLALIACGDDGGNSNPDAAPIPDAGRVCISTTVGTTLVIGDGADDMSASWSGPLTADVGTGGDVIVNFEFYSGSTLTGPIDLATGVNANYETCAACIRVIALNAAGDAVDKTFFQDGGTLTLTQDPLSTLKLIGTATDVTLVEVTIDPDTFKSTLVPGGVCLSLGPVVNLNADAIPADWTCPDAAYMDGTTCNCMCGAHDPDCDVATAPVAGCTAGQICGGNDTCISVCNVLSTPTVGCTTGACGYQSATQDICYTATTAVDPAVLGGTCTSTTALLCAVVNTVGTGICDGFEGDDKGCRKACDANADCAGAEVCAPIIGMSMKGLCITPPVNDTCGTAGTIVIGTPVNGKTGGATANYNLGLEGACTGSAQQGGDVAYQVVLTANQVITVTLSNVSANFDPSVALLGPGAAATVCPGLPASGPVTCLKGADAALDGLGETFTFTATAAGTYFLIVDTFYRNQGGSFTLNVTSP